MSDNSITRVRFYQRQFLRTQDLTDEQAYHLAMRRRHNLAHHTWGIVAGLALQQDQDGRLWVEPGMAIDGYGRELILDERQQLDTDAFEQNLSDRLDVWLRYQRDPASASANGRALCVASAEDDRWRERATILLAEPPGPQPDRRKLATVPPGDWDFAPWRTPPDDPIEDWPVFLGQIQREPAKPAGRWKYSVVEPHGDRPYVGLVGAEIRAPSGRARVCLGGADTSRFRVLVEQTRAGGAEPSLAEALAIDADGRLSIANHATVGGTLTLDGGLLLEPAGEQQTHPWQLYRYEQAQAHELRVELGQQKGDQVAVGAWSADQGEFLPILTVHGADGQASRAQVSIHGDLMVEGTITPTQRVNPLSSQQARSMTLAVLLGALSDRELLHVIQDKDYLARLLDDPAGRVQLVQSLQAEPARFQQVLQALLASSTLLAGVGKQVAAHTEWSEALLADILGAATGRAALEAVVASNRDLSQQVVDALFRAEGGRPLIFSQILGSDSNWRALVLTLADASKQAQCIGALLENARLRLSLIEQLAGEPYREEVGKALIASLLKEDSSKQARWVGALLENDQLRPAVIEQLAGEPYREEVGKALIASLLKEEGRATLVRLLQRPAVQKALLEILLQNLDLFEQILTRLLRMSAAASAGDAVNQLLEQLLRDEARRKQIAARLLLTPALRMAVITALLDQQNESVLQAFLIELLAQPKHRRQIIDALLVEKDRHSLGALVAQLLEYSESHPLIIDRLRKQPELIQQALDGQLLVVVKELSTNEAWFNHLLTLLTADAFKPLAQRLAAALPPAAGKGGPG